LNCGEKWGKRVGQSMIDNVKEARLGCFGERRGDTLAKSKVLLFCLKHPRMKFTVECIGVNQEINKAALEEEIQSLVDQGVVNKHISGAGTIFYFSNRTQEELTKLTEVLPLI
jgi:hypothetical protein